MCDIITSRDNARVKALAALRHNRDRLEQSRYIVEGEKLVDEAVAYADVETLMFAEHDAVKYAERYSGVVCEKLVLADHVFDKVCDTRTPQGVIATVKMPPDRMPEGLLEGFVVALECIQDPGNLGAILRSANALGALAVVLLPGCASWHSPKVVRASMGAQFHIPIIGMTLDELLLHKNGRYFIAADVNGSETAPTKHVNTVLLIGNEGAGLSEQLLAAADYKYRLPMKGKAQSLNAAVAAGIIMYKLI